jgi:predicted phage tail protein
MGGRIKTATSTAVTLDAPVTLLAGKTYTLACKLPDGTVEARPVTTGSGTVSTLAVSAAYSVAPQALSQWLLATTDAPATKYRAVSIKEAKGGASYDIVGLIHNPDKYAAIETGLTV